MSDNTDSVPDEVIYKPIDIWAYLELVNRINDKSERESFDRSLYELTKEHRNER